MDILTQLGRFSVCETNRVLLRPFTFEDSQDFWEICSNPENVSFIFPSRVSQEESDYLLVHYFMKNPLGTWAIEDKASGKMIGAIRFEKLDEASWSAEVGYFLHKAYWGQGIMTECLKTITFLAFQEFGLNSLDIIVHKENVSSCKVAQKSGYQCVKQFKGSDRYTHKIRDYVCYQMSRSGYRNE